MTNTAVTRTVSTDELMPLYYAILKHFVDGQQYCTQDVIDALKPLYGSYKLLNPKDVEEALATAKENGLLDEVAYDLDDSGALRVYFKMTDFGQDMVDRYIGKYSNPV